MAEGHSKYVYAEFLGGLYRFRWRSWVRFLDLMATSSLGERTIEDYGDYLGELRKELVDWTIEDAVGELKRMKISHPRFRSVALDDAQW